MRLIVANDVELNPGDFVNSFFNFCNWNLNSIAKDHFSRVKLLEIHHCISVYETCLNDSVELSGIRLSNYTFVIILITSEEMELVCFYKNDLPLKIRRDLAIDESTVAELVFGQKK